MRVLSLDHISLPVQDVEASLRFYGEVLGLELVDLSEFRRGLVPYPSVRVGSGLLLGLVPMPAHQGSSGLHHIALEVEHTELSATAQRLREQGYTVESDLRRRPGARGQAVSVVVCDPDGHRVQLRYY